MSHTYVVIEVDDLAVSVDAEEYSCDPEGVAEQVRANRRAVRVGSDPVEADRLLGHG